MRKVAQRRLIRRLLPSAALLLVPACSVDYEHVVRRYPDVGDDAAFDDAVATLANCDRSRLTYPDQSVFQVTVAPRPIAMIGDEARSATIDVSTSLVQATSTLALVRKTDRLAILSVSGLEQPDLGLIGDLTAWVAQGLSAI